MSITKRQYYALLVLLGLCVIVDAFNRNWVGLGFMAVGYIIGRNLR